MLTYLSIIIMKITIKQNSPLITIFFIFRSVLKASSWDEFMNVARKTIFDGDAMSANVFEFMMMNFTEVNRKYTTSLAFGYTKSIYKIVEGNTTWDPKQMDVINNIFKVTFDVRIHLIVILESF